MINRGLIDDVYLTRDLAATGIGVTQASHFNRVYGTPSFNGYYHPGAAWMYFVALIYSFLSLLNHNSNLVFSFLLANTIIVVLYLIVIYQSTQGLFTPIGRQVFILTILIFLLVTPEYVSLPWEPHISAMIVLISYGFAISAAFSKPKSIAAFINCVLSGLSAGFAINLQLTVALPSVFIMLYMHLLLLYNYRSISVVLYYFFFYTLSMCVFFIPTFIDVIFLNHTNFSAYLLYSSSVSAIGHIKLFDSIILLFSYIVTKHIVFFSVSYVMLAWSTKISYLRPNLYFISIVTGSIIIILLPIIFFSFIAPKSYTPLHAASYAQLMFGFLLSLFAVVLFESTNAKFRAGWLIFSLCLFFILLLSYPPQIISNGYGFLYSTNFKTLLTDISNKHSQIAISIQAPSSNVNSSENIRELPWSLAVGLANMLQIADIPYCYWYSNSSEPVQFFDQTMLRFLETRSCGATNYYVKYYIYCNNNKLRISSSDKVYDIYNC